MKVTKKRYQELKELLTPEELDSFEVATTIPVSVNEFLTTRQISELDWCVLKQPNNEVIYAYDDSYIVPVYFDLYANALTFLEEITTED